MKNLWRGWAHNAVFSHSNSVKFYRCYDLRVGEIACVSPKQVGLSNVGVLPDEYFFSKVIYEVYCNLWCRNVWRTRAHNMVLSHSKKLKFHRH